jgi:hypothetical protein
MDNEVITQTKADREILSFDVSDELLERAANAEQSGFLWHFALAIGTAAAFPQWRADAGSFAIFAAILRASTVDEVNSDTSHIGGNSHRDNNRHCNIDTETPRHRDEHNPNSRRNKTPVKVSQLCSGLGDGDGGPCAVLPLAQTERLYLRALLSKAA